MSFPSFFSFLFLGGGAGAPDQTNSIMRGNPGGRRACVLC
jgi:hypothetical protein